MKLAVCPQCGCGNRSERYWCSACIEREGWTAYALWLEAELTRQVQSEAMLRAMARDEIHRLEDDTHLPTVMGIEGMDGVPPQ
jgi:hypothetical protein